MDELKMYVPDVSSSMCGHGGVFFYSFCIKRRGVQIQQFNLTETFLRLPKSLIL